MKHDLIVGDEARFTAPVLADEAEGEIRLARAGGSAQKRRARAAGDTGSVHVEGGCVQAHGGTIVAGNRMKDGEVRGACFTVELPEAS